MVDNPFKKDDYVLIARLDPSWDPYYRFLKGRVCVVLSVDDIYCNLQTVVTKDKYRIKSAYLDIMTPPLPGHGPNNIHIAQELPP